MNCLILWIIPKPSPTVVNFVPIHEYLHNHKLKCKEEQERGCSHYWEMIPYSAGICRVERFNKLISLKKNLSTSAA